MTKIDSNHISELLAPGDAERASNADKGTALEGAIRYAFTQIPGVACETQDTRNAFETEELDLLLTNLPHVKGLAHFGPEILVEAKNWSSKVGAIEINWFATKMRRRSLTDGILVAARDITGDAERLTAARQQIVLALNEGQQVLVLTRKELEAVRSGERLAQLLRKKRTELIARQDIYLAAPEELRHRGGEMRRGSRAFKELLREERLGRIEEAQARKRELPAEDAERATLLEVGLDAVDRELETHKANPGRDPRGRALREELMEIAATCVAWLEGMGFEEADTIYVNGILSGMDRMRVSPGSKLWKLLTKYYGEELASTQPEVGKDQMLFALTTLLIEEIWSLDEYWPEPDEC